MNKENNKFNNKNKYIHLFEYKIHIFYIIITYLLKIKFRKIAENVKK